MTEGQVFAEKSRCRLTWAHGIRWLPAISFITHPYGPISFFSAHPLRDKAAGAKLISMNGIHYWMGCKPIQLAYCTFLWLKWQVVTATRHAKTTEVERLDIIAIVQIVYLQFPSRIQNYSDTKLLIKMMLLEVNEI